MTEDEFFFFFVIFKMRFEMVWCAYTLVNLFHFNIFMCVLFRCFFFFIFCFAFDWQRFLMITFNGIFFHEPKHTFGVTHQRNKKNQRKTLCVVYESEWQITFIFKILAKCVFKVSNDYILEKFEQIVQMDRTLFISQIKSKI